MIYYILCILLISTTNAQCDFYNHSYDTVLLEYQYPPAHGVDHVKHHTIHGLWPSRRATLSYPCYCDEDFDVKRLDPIRDQLDENWITLYHNHSREWLWEHEFTKHGSCMFNYTSELQYFNTTLTLYHRFLRPEHHADYSVCLKQTHLGDYVPCQYTEVYE